MPCHTNENSADSNTCPVTFPDTQKHHYAGYSENAPCYKDPLPRAMCFLNLLGFLCKEGFLILFKECGLLRNGLPGMVAIQASPQPHYNTNQ